MKQEWARVVRTTVQVAVGLLPILPVLMDEFGINATAGMGAAVLAAAATLTRIMQIPVVDQWIQKLLRSTENQ